MAEAIEPNAMETDDAELAAFERQLEAVLALDPVERIQSYRAVAEELDRELNGN